MNGVTDVLVKETIQCWGCPVFDRLFQIVSGAAAAVYDKFVVFCTVLFCVLFAFFVINAVWNNIKSKEPDPWMNKSVMKVVITAVVTLSLLAMGVKFPRFITTITFEPVANITLTYTQALIQTTPEIANEKVTYQPMEMADDGFYRPELRDTIILMMKTAITQFQSYIKLGIAIMDKAFSWSALFGVGALIKHIIMFLVGLALTWAFFKLFWRFCCYFADIIVAMAFFAFFFPLSLMLMSFKGAEHAPKWITKLGSGVGTAQFKNLINAIVGLAAAVITYTVVMVVIAKFFSAPDVSSVNLMDAILSGRVFEGDLNMENMESLTLMSATVLVYILNFLIKQIPTVTSMILSAFNVKADTKLSDQLADDVMALTGAAWDITKTKAAEFAQLITTGDKKEEKKAEGEKPKEGSK